MAHLIAPDAGASPVSSSHLFDVTIIGGGPVGLFAAFYAGLRQMTTKIIDSLDELGGQLTALYPEKFVFDVAGFPKVYARDLAKNLIEQAMEYHPTINLGETCKTLTLLKTAEDAKDAPAEVQGAIAEGITVYRVASDKGTHYTRTLIIAAGAGAFAPRKLALKEPTTALENRGLFYSCKSKSIFANKRVLIAGGGDSAIDWALNLRETAAGHDGSGITLLHRTNKFRAHEDSVRRLQATKSKILTFTQIESFIVSDGHIKGANLVNDHDKANVQRFAVECDAVLVQFGFISSLGAMENWPIKIEKKKSILVNHVMETNLPGIFAVGDVATFEKPEAKLKLIVTGFGEAAIAVCTAKTRIDPHAKMFPGHSSEMTSQAESVVTV